MTSVRNYTMTRGIPWERLLIVKNERTHRMLQVTSVNAMVQTDTTKIPIPATVSSENGILLYFDEVSSLSIPAGSWSYDVVASVYSLSNSVTTTQVVAKGTLTVEDLGNITPLEAADQMEIRFKKGEDFRQDFTWTDASGNLISVSKAYMTAADSTGASVINLNWYASAPSAATIAALPAGQRGYLVPVNGETVQLYISWNNSVPAGTYTFDMFVQNAASLDWSCLSSGSVIVDSSVTKNSG